MTKSKKTRAGLRAKNLCWNRHYSQVISPLENNEQQSLQIIELAHQLLSQFQTDDLINYCIFSVERGQTQDNLSFHFQGYLEFPYQRSLPSFQKKFKLTCLEPRQGTQKQALDYVLKNKTKLIPQTFSFGKPKSVLLGHNISDPEIPYSSDSQLLLLEKRFCDQYYPNFQSARLDFTLLMRKHDLLCRRLWNDYHSIPFDILPAKTIWLYGPSGIGKTTWTIKYLKDLNYLPEHVSKKKASNERRPKLWFHNSDETKKILWIEEVRTNFPDYNDIIQFIDKAVFLETKGSHVENNFELVIFHSLLSPDKIFSHLRKEHQVEILRRLYLSPHCQVLRFFPDQKNFNRILDVTKKLPEILRQNRKLFHS